jgi:C-terminal processing protease CtpA/Prc
VDIIDSLKTAVLTFNTFIDPSYVKFLKGSFNTIKQKHIENVIIDLRNNRGGYDKFGVSLYSYLTLSPFKFYDHLEMKLDSINDPILKYGSMTEATGFRDFFDKNHSKTISNGNYILKKKQHPLDTDISFLPEKNTFVGNVYILISGKSFSGASEFAAITQFHQRAKFIGQETAGGCCEETSGFNFIMNLPNTKIRVAIPVIRYFEAIDNCKNTGGVKPDFEIKPEISDLNSDIDREMEFTLDLIRKK